MISAHTLEGWAELWAATTHEIDVLANASTSGSAEYLRLLDLAERCRDAIAHALDEATMLTGFEVEQPQVCGAGCNGSGIDPSSDDTCDCGGSGYKRLDN